MEITDEMVEALRRIVRHRLEMWNGMRDFEELAGCDLDRDGDKYGENVMVSLAQDAISPDDVNITAEDVKRLLKSCGVDV